MTRILKQVKNLVLATPLAQKLIKPRMELEYWRQHFHVWIPEWYEGKRPFHFPFPSEAEKEKQFDLKTNAFLTYIRAELRHAPYLRDLALHAGVFRGLRVADIGCGPFPNLLVFDQCQRWGFDHLIEAYKRLGYPLDRFDMQFVNCKSESIAVPDRYFDAVVSRNALDHVDDFEKTAAEIRRILKPNGYLAIQAHYHRPTWTEPLVLNDDRILSAFGSLGVRKISTLEGAWGFAEGQTVVWSNLSTEQGAPLDRNQPAEQVRVVS